MGGIFGRPCPRRTGGQSPAAADFTASLKPNTAAIAQALGDVHGLLHAETLTFILAEQIQRPEAQDIVKDMCRRTVASGTPPLVLVATRFPQVDWHLRHSSSLLGQIPAEARTFAQRASRLK